MINSVCFFDAQATHQTKKKKQNQTRDERKTFECIILLNSSAQLREKEYSERIAYRIEKKNW